jgi:hypothetical protein
MGKSENLRCSSTTHKEAAKAAAEAPVELEGALFPYGSNGSRVKPSDMKLGVRFDSSRHNLLVRPSRAFFGKCYYPRRFQHRIE